LIIVGDVEGKLGRQYLNFPGHRFNRFKLARLVPKDFDLYVEPFAGHAWLFREVKPKKAVLGDIQCRVWDWIKKWHKPSGDVQFKCQDWRKTVKQTDSPKTFFVFDPPWPDHRCFAQYRGHCDDYRREVIEVAKRLKGKSMITFFPSEENRELLCKPPFKCRVVKTVHGQKNYKLLVGMNY